MSEIISVESEAFKLRINAKEKDDHNFRPRSRAIELTACKNSFAAFQIVIHCDYRVCVSLTDAMWMSEYSDANVLYLRHYGDLKPVMNHVGLYLGDDGNLYGDALKSDPVVDVEPNCPTSVFVRFEIPKSIAPGKYTGVFKVLSTHMFSDETLLDRIEYTVNVVDVCLPDPADHRFELDLWQHNCNIARKAGIPNWCDRHFEILGKYVKTLADLGQRSVTAVVSEIPWCGQRCFQEKQTPSNLFEYSMISVRKNPDKSYTYDYTVLDRYIELCFKNGIDKEIEIFGLVNNWISVNDGFLNFTDTPEAIRIRYKTPDGSYKFMKKAADIENYIRSLQEHLAEKGWLDKTVVMADEPADHEALHKTLKMIKRVAPGFRIKAAFGRKAFYDEFKDEIDDFCVIITGLTLAADEWRKVFSEPCNHKFSYYVCCFPPYPNTYLSSNLLETRYLMLLVDYFRLSGFLRWNFTVWPKEPRLDIRYASFPAGDTNFVYPSGDMDPLLTLRYMALRRGIEDFELLCALREAGLDDVVNEVHDMILTNREFNRFYDDEDKPTISFEEMSKAKYKDYEKMRQKIYDALTL